ncbi:hypothetical protein BDP27DRAFT_1362457 [Rhodocollybia butyracea]|uniref:Uncharacterized protein n=1 Tax=Rhodocollybia butyracea TaxID=206335 RepID=A0A9P5U849_9AGAR|nr:hypothetical protein BDP27DRAFT_1362457 [Rhodocollybia butyracea]
MSLSTARSSLSRTFFGFNGQPYPVPAANALKSFASLIVTRNLSQKYIKKYGLPGLYSPSEFPLLTDYEEPLVILTCSAYDFQSCTAANPGERRQRHPRRDEQRIPDIGAGAANRNKARDSKRSEALNQYYLINFLRFPVSRKTIINFLEHGYPTPCPLFIYSPGSNASIPSSLAYNLSYSPTEIDLQNFVFSPLFRVASNTDGDFKKRLRAERREESPEDMDYGNSGGIGIREEERIENREVER